MEQSLQLNSKLGNLRRFCTNVTQTYLVKILKTRQNEKKIKEKNEQKRQIKFSFRIVTFRLERECE